MPTLFQQSFSVSDFEGSIVRDTRSWSINHNFINIEKKEDKYVGTYTGGDNDHFLFGFEERDSHLHLYHLESPRTGEGFGKFSLQIFKYILDFTWYKYFSIKFGGGENSKGWLNNLGFRKTAVFDSEDFDGVSAVVGEVREDSIKPIHKTNFPEQF